MEFSLSCYTPTEEKGVICAHMYALVVRAEDSVVPNTALCAEAHSSELKFLCYYRSQIF